MVPSRSIGKVKGGNKERLCIGCGRLYRKDWLMRVAVSRQGDAFLDTDQKGGGRGLYLCPLWDCVLVAHHHWKGKTLAKGRLPRGLTKDLAIPLIHRAHLTSGDPFRLRYGRRLVQRQR